MQGYREEMRTKFCSGYLNKNHNLENTGVDGKNNIILYLEQYRVKMWIGFIWLRIGSNSWLLRIR
jgi:hypothetical protein